VTERLVGFARELRANGIPIGSGDVVDFVASTEVVGDVYWCGRTVLLSAPHQTPVYDRVFAEFFGEVQPAAARRRGGIESEISLRRGPAASPYEMFGRMPVAPGDDVPPFMLDLPLRPSRRRRPSRRPGDLDLRRTLRHAARSDGEVLRLARRTRRSRPRRVVLLLDVSGSMSSYARRLVVAAHASIHQRRRWEVFCFATRLTRLTHVLSHREPHTALSAAAEAVADWEGGTQIGQALKQFIDGYGHRGVARGAVVVICSDGFDVGESDLLGEQMARLSRLAHSVVWLNPLLELESYEPRSAAMRAALPYVDLFAPWRESPAPRRGATGARR
jgi:uncharacterized protein with von Willebrand factor type A (vWA) domain